MSIDYDIVKRKNVYSNNGIMSVLGYTTHEIEKMGDKVVQMLMHPDDFTIEI